MAEADDQTAACAKAREEVNRLERLADRITTPTAGMLIGGVISAGAGFLTLDPPLAIFGGTLIAGGVAGLNKIAEIAMEQEPAARKETYKACSEPPPSKAFKERQR